MKVWISVGDNAVGDRQRSEGEHPLHKDNHQFLNEKQRQILNEKNQNLNELKTHQILNGTYGSSSNLKWKKCKT